jgi:inorganic pyrophosphatase
MTNLLKIPAWADDQSIYAVVETPRGSSCKLDFDPELRVFTLAKPLMVGLTYPYDWGFIPSTEAEDGDSSRRPGGSRRANLSRRGSSMQARGSP